MRIKPIILRQLRNAAHFSLLNEFKRLVEVFTPEALKIAALFAEFMLLFTKLDMLYKKIVKSLFTEQIQDADKARDETWRGLMDAISSALRHFDPLVRTAAKQLSIVCKTYGNVPKMSLNEETSAIINFVQDLEGPYASHVAATGLGAWILELKARNITFANLVRDRAYEKSLKDLTELRKARAKIDGKLYEIWDCLNAFALLESHSVVEGTGIYDRFAAEFNVHVDKSNLLIAQASKKGKKGKKGAENTQTDGGSDE